MLSPLFSSNQVHSFLLMTEETVKTAICSSFSFIAIKSIILVGEKGERERVRVNMKRFQETMVTLNQYGHSPEGMNRIAYTRSEQQAVQYMVDLFTKEGLDVRVDEIGNVIARREGSDPSLPAVACGSHIDTVYNGGQYDGTIGVLAGLEIIRQLNEENIVTNHPLELIIFACEESSRFGVATIGSKAMIGHLQKHDVATLVDKDGITFAEALAACQLTVTEISKATRTQEEIKVFYELHVEQGPVLENDHTQIGIVTGIAAPTRFEVMIQGRESHSGSTPMWLRRDAFLGAAEIALLAEQLARMEAPNGTVATVGHCSVQPGAMNVVPGEATMLIDIRSIFTQSKQKVVTKLQRGIAEIAEKRQLHIEIKKLCEEEPVKMNVQVIQSIKDSCQHLGYRYLEMPSGAGHDAMNLAKQYPTGMIFIPSQAGLSHHKNEYTELKAIDIGVTLLKKELLKAAKVLT